jgi:hypothetical protein
MPISGEMEERERKNTGIKRRTGIIRTRKQRKNM